MKNLISSTFLIAVSVYFALARLTFGILKGLKPLQIKKL